MLYNVSTCTWKLYSMFGRSEMWLHTIRGVPKEPLPGGITTTGG